MGTPGNFGLSRVDRGVSGPRLCGSFVSQLYSEEFTCDLLSTSVTNVRYLYILYKYNIQHTSFVSLAHLQSKVYCFTVWITRHFGLIPSHQRSSCQTQSCLSTWALRLASVKCGVSRHVQGPISPCMKNEDFWKGRSECKNSGVLVPYLYCTDVVGSSFLYQPPATLWTNPITNPNEKKHILTKLRNGHHCATFGKTSSYPRDSVCTVQYKYE